MPEAESEEVREELSRLVGTEFRVGEPSATDVVSRGGVSWFVSARNPAATRATDDVEAAWKDMEGKIWLQSSVFGDTSRLIEEMYGEEAAYDILDMNLTDFGKPEFMSEFEKEFPRVLGRLSVYDGLAMAISRKYGIHLEVLYHGGKGVASFRLGARIDDKSEKDGTLKTIGVAVKALREAFTEIKTY